MPTYRKLLFWVPRSLVLTVTLVQTIPAARAEGVTTEEAVKYLLILSSGAGSEGRVACKELDMAIQLKKRDVSVDAKANVAWAFTAEQTRFYAAEKKLVVCNNRKLLAEGGAVAFERIGGKLTIFVHQVNLAKCSVTLPESFLRTVVKV